MPPKNRKNKDIWTVDAEFVLIQEVEKRPLLWDATLDVYRRADLKGPAFEEIAAIISATTKIDNITGAYFLNINCLATSPKEVEFRFSKFRLSCALFQVKVMSTKMLFLDDFRAVVCRQMEKYEVNFCR